MRHIFYLFVLFFITFASSSPLPNKYKTDNQNPAYLSQIILESRQNASYGELAQILMQPALDQMNKNMHTLNNTSLPSDVKLLRNNFLSVRNILDVFVFAYPKPNPLGTDTFLIAREDMNVGYTLVGDFKDLSDSHVNYTYDEMVTARGKCLKWQEGYFSNAQKYNYSFYFSNPSKTALFKRHSDDLSPFFWGAVDDLMPSLSRTGYENIAYLMDALTTTAIQEYPTFCNLSHVYQSHTQKIFHNYRKSVRGINSVSTFANEIYKPNSPCVQPAIAVTTQLYSMIGKIEDHIAAYNFYEQNKEHEKAQDEKGTIEKMWASLQQWMSNNHPDKSLQCLDDSLIPFPK